jgi:hypothetical protein
MSELKPIHGALLVVLSMASGCMCERSINIGPGGRNVDFQSCPPGEVRAAVSEFETEFRKRPPSPDESRIRDEAFSLLGRVQRLIDQPSKSRNPSDTRQQIDAALTKLRALPATKP